MKALTICCLALLVLFATSANGFCSPDQKVKELEQKMAYLEGAFVQIMGELQATVQDAKPVYAVAEKILKTKSKGFTWEEKAKINLAAFYEQRIMYLQALIKLIILESTITAKEIETLKKQKEA